MLLRLLRPALLAGYLMASACFISPARGQDPGQDRGTIQDPDGFSNLRSGQGTKTAVIARVPAGEVFDFEGEEDSDWWKVTLASGKSGWMHASRIRFYHTLDELPEKRDPNEEVVLYGNSRGINYSKIAREAAQGNSKAMKVFFGITDADGAAAESHVYFLRVALHILGDKKLADFLSNQPLEFQIGLRNQLDEMVFYPFEPEGYFDRNFPKTAALLRQKDLTHWVSPDGRYAIRKTFSTDRPAPDSRVTKSEVIEMATGKVVGDLSESDIGTGTFREGEVLWSPDSKHFAAFSQQGLTGGAQTSIYRLTGNSFTLVDQPKVSLPIRNGDAELQGAELLWSRVSPLRWANSKTIVMEQHCYLEALRADRSINQIGRTYELTWDLDAETIKVKDISAR